jgi:fructose-1,6-bisphosphatase/inositol monophosphatase family enzyme
VGPYFGGSSRPTSWHRWKRSNPSSRRSPLAAVAGHDYPAVATGALDFALFRRTLPWDHVPGALFVSEAGGVAARLDGSKYMAADHARPGLLVARNANVWGRVRNTLVP